MRWGGRAGGRYSQGKEDRESGRIHHLMLDPFPRSQGNPRLLDLYHLLGKKIIFIYFCVSHLWVSLDRTFTTSFGSVCPGGNLMYFGQHMIYKPFLGHPDNYISKFSISLYFPNHEASDTLSLFFLLIHFLISFGSPFLSSIFLSQAI